MNSKKTVILDNGAYSIKAGYSNAVEPRVFPNSIVKSKSDRKRVYVADEVEECQDRSSLYFVLPFERGYIVKWDSQFTIWDRIFGKEGLDVDFQECRLILTDPSDIARAVPGNIPEVIFETYQFDSLLKTSAPSCVAQWENKADVSNPCCVVVDSGYSFTHIVPFVNGRIMRSGTVRIDIGGKALTNQLKEWISYRQLDMREETYMMNQCKEDTCFVTTDIHKCMIRGSTAIKQEYALPEFNETRGFLVTPSRPPGERQKISLGVERFAVPEILFHPSDIGKDQMGIVEGLNHSLAQFSEEVRFEMLKKIILIGGNTKFEGYKERIEMDLRSYVDGMFDFTVVKPDDPITHTWKCASRLVSNDSSFQSRFVSRTEYAEKGENVCRQRFQNYFSESI
ncbi:actin domain-containing protein [Ditylenchus destructor]|nr:actin domain-containing protein [Ditylenchus destructor]